MSPLEMTALARVPLYVLRWSEEQGVARHELLNLSGIAESELTDPDARVPVSQLWNLWRILMEKIPDPHLGLHIGESSKIRDFGLVGYSIYHSRTLEVALHRVARYSRIVSEVVVIHLIRDESQGKLVIENTPRFDELRHPVDVKMSWNLAVAREVTGAEIVPLEARFPYPRPADATEHQRIFRSPLKFDQPEAMLVFRNEDLERTVVAADETLSGYLDRLAESVLKSLSESVSFTDRVRREIWSDLSSGKPSVKRVSSQLGVSPRTLQRRLEEEGTTFAAELDGLRHEMATRLLQDRNLAVYEVAFLLGYSEPSTFYRAFRRWKRLSPHEFRRSAS